ncbi:MAG: molybdate ABC transporter substrate-binding protein [Alphaproteobacteria bacterium]
MSVPDTNRSRPLRAMMAMAWLAAACGGLGTAAAADEITLFAAASLKNALTTVSAGFNTPGCRAPRISFTGSQILALQIERGAPADIVVTADEAWMNYLQERGLLVAASRRPLLTNTLVVVVPKGQAPESFALEDLEQLIGQGRLALANTNTVPAGRYARAALDSLGLWSDLQHAIVQGESVRAALAFVARGETPAGIVYATDAAAEPAVEVIATLPPGSHPPIRYPVALVAGASDCAYDYLAHLRSEESKAIFRADGFKILD